MTKEIISVEQLHKIVNSAHIRKIRLIDHTVLDGRPYDVWVVEYPDQPESIRYYTPQS